MDRSEAEALVGLLQAYFPRPEFPESTVHVWAAEIEAFELEDAQVAVRWVAHNRTYPVLAELLDAIRQAWRERLAAERPELIARSWTAEDEAESMEIGAKVLADWRRARASVVARGSDEARPA
jgi:hypothetical protein